MSEQEFKREIRYDVVKLKTGKKVNCVVVEEDWPEYEIVWKMLQDRMEGRPYSFLPSDQTPIGFINFDALDNWPSDNIAHELIIARKKNGFYKTAIYAEPVSELSASQAREAELREKLEAAMRLVTKTIAENESVKRENAELKRHVEALQKFDCACHHDTPDDICEYHRKLLESKVPEVYCVFHEEEFVGSFFQHPFSSERLAKEWIAAQTNYPQDECSVFKYVVDPKAVQPKEPKQ